MNSIEIRSSDFPLSDSSNLVDDVTEKSPGNWVSLSIEVIATICMYLQVTMIKLQNKVYAHKL